MKKIALLFSCLLLPILLFGQSASGLKIKKDLDVMLPETLSRMQMEWVMLDADTLPDLVVVGIAQDGFLHILSLKNKLTSLEWKNTHVTSLQSGYLQLADINRDNKIDLLIAGKGQQNNGGLFLFRNKGDFTYSTSRLIDRTGAFRVADFNNDGKPDLLTYDSLPGSSLTLFKRDALGYSVAYDSAPFSVRDIAVSDFNQDGSPDFVASGSDKSKKAFTTLFTAIENKQFITRKLLSPVAGLLSAYDVNGDGWMDLLGMGTASAGSTQTIWTNDKTGDLIVSSSGASPVREFIFTGDLNSDGSSDVLSILSGSSRSISINLNSNVQSLTLPGLQILRSGDYDGDGDLDIGYLKDSVSQQWINVLRVDVADFNHKPAVPSGPYAISTDRKTFIVWESANDDHTPSTTLTYDVWLQSDSTILAPNFQLGTSARMLVAHGNAGTAHSKIVKGLKDGKYNFLIQTVDNAYRGSEFARGTCVLCFDLAHQDVNACKDQQLSLAASGEADWFSSVNGFIKRASSLTFTAAQNDTIYAFIPQGSDCAKNKIFRIHVFDSPFQDQKIYGCEGAVLKLSLDPGWQTVEWNTTPVLTNVNSVQVTLDKDKDITATAVGGPGCTFKKTFQLKLSTPKLSLNGVSFRIKKGGSVQLEAYGTFDKYAWTPVSGLSNPSISNPVAEPTSGTIYQLIATDSVGCSATGEIQIQVEFSAFVPNLFTPNGDNKNDNLLVYGLGDTSGFLFQVFNRDGSLVFETTDPAAASQSGWNGYVNGTRQPPGVYYWKVEGHTGTGDPLLLNGKKTGSVLLIH